MAGPALPENVASTYGSGPHTSHHDAIHDIVNKFDKDDAPAQYETLVYDGSLWQPTSPVRTHAVGSPEGQVPHTNLSSIGVNDHHQQDHADGVHTGPNKLEWLKSAVSKATRAYANFTDGFKVVDNAGAGRVDISTITESVVMRGTSTGAFTPAVAVQDLSNTQIHFLKKDLTAATDCRISVRVLSAAIDCKVAVQYATDGATWKWIDGTASASAPPANTYVQTGTTASTTVVSAWLAVATAMAADVHLRLVTRDGDAASSVTLGLIAVEFR